MIQGAYQTSRVAQPGAGECAPLPPCPVCGGLECLCRPRFFAGQLLTEQDLNRLDRYIIEKNKLHNRYLHGWGVVCGLEVVCHPCADRVTVRTGYALSPCGDDIVVCRDEIVNICDLIHRCGAPQTPQECVPPRAGGDANCRDVVEEWVLAICYDEKPTRGVTALKGGSGAACCSRCACGGSSACGCGCHGANGSGHTSNGQGTRTQKTTAPQCEPTMICEGYTFTVYKAPPQDPVSQPDPAGSGFRPAGSLVGPLAGAATPAASQTAASELVRRILACWQALLSRISRIPVGRTKEELHAWCCEIKEALLEFFTQHPTYDCTLYERLSRIVCPVPDPAESDDAYAGRLAPIVSELAQVGAEYLRYCICAALLPPCPPPVDCNCVPLATVRVRKSDCRILQVCNWGPRRFVVTFPTLGYWLDPSGLFQALRRSLERLCCTPLPRRAVRVLPRPVNRLERAAGAAVGADAVNIRAVRSVPLSRAAGTPFSALLSQSYVNRARSVDAQTVLLAALGASDENDNPLATEMELDHPAQFLLANQLARPALDAVLPPELSQLMEAVTGGAAEPGRGAAGPALTEEVAALRGLVAEMQKTVQAQGEEIRRLREGSG